MLLVRYDKMTSKCKRIEGINLMRISVHISPGSFVVISLMILIQRFLHKLIDYEKATHLHHII